MFTTIRAGMALWATRTMMRAAYAPLLVGSRTRKHQPRATASFGVPAPISRRISSLRLRESGCFVQPASSRDAIEDLEALASPVMAFVRDRCTLEPGRRML